MKHKELSKGDLIHSVNKLFVDVKQIKDPKEKLKLNTIKKQVIVAINNGSVTDMDDVGEIISTLEANAI